MPVSQLSVRPPAYTLPPYSLTGDLLGFLRCGLQYRYSRIGQLPPTRPVQLWFGQFIHGVMEEAFRRFDEARKVGKHDLPPWSEVVEEEICGLLMRRLAAQGLFPWSPDLERLGRARAEAAINDLGPALLPLIHRAEVRLTGARAIPSGAIPKQYQLRSVDRYEAVGVIDVLTHLELRDPAHQTNPIVQRILQHLPEDPPDQFEVIIDYKGMRRPDPSDPYLPYYEWQIQTYAHLRSAQADSFPVLGGVLLYVNELLPTWEDLENLQKAVRNGTTDVPPSPGSETETLLFSLEKRRFPTDPETGRRPYPPKLPGSFRLLRAMKFIPADHASVATALSKFDETVVKIETCRGMEEATSSIQRAWTNYSKEEDTCVVCDHRTYCPGFVANFNGGRPMTPEPPGVKT